MNLEGLNKEQKEATTTVNGPILVLAGAGSGKTRVLTTRVSYLIEQGIKPENILAITFTNKAAKEMRERIINILGPTAFQIQISTFHSFGLLILRENYEALGYKRNFTILDSDDSLTIIKKIMRDHNIDIKEYNPKGIKNRISSAKNELIDPNKYEQYANTDFEEKVVLVYKEYQRKLVINNSVDFDDLLILPINLFKKHKDTLEHYQEKYKYIMIDEYQDTNQAQYTLTKLLSDKYKNIFVVGDNDQSIYSFRGSNYRNILNFETDYKDAKVIMLEENYRSTKTILDAANSVIKNNNERKDKNLWTNNNEGSKIRYHRANTEKDEARFITNEINKLIEKGTKLKEIAVLYRTNAQSRNIEEQFLRENIPYKVVGSFYFYNRKEIKDLIAYLKLIYNPYDDVSLMRVINTPKRGIGSKTIENLGIKASTNNLSMFDAIDSGKELEFKKIIDEIIKIKDTLSLTELVDLILDKSGIRKELKSDSSMESEIRLENLEEFKTITKEFEERNGIISLSEFLEEISLVSDIEEYKNNDEVVTLMTVHSAKGLEFNTVFVVGLEEGIFPHSNSFSSLSDLEEERRLCYVAMTRAKENLYLINTKRRAIYGMENANPPSRFINEIDEDYLDIDVDIKEVFDKNIDVSKEEYSMGEHINHETFGIGVIVGIDKQILTVAFSHPHGIKQILKGHRSIRKV